MWVNRWTVSSYSCGYGREVYAQVICRGLGRTHTHKRVPSHAHYHKIKYTYSLYKTEKRGILMKVSGVFLMVKHLHSSRALFTQSEPITFRLSAGNLKLTCHRQVIHNYCSFTRSYLRRYPLSSLLSPSFPSSLLLNVC